VFAYGTKLAIIVTQACRLVGLDVMNFELQTEVYI